MLLNTSEVKLLCAETTKQDEWIQIPPKSVSGKNNCYSNYTSLVIILAPLALLKDEFLIILILQLVLIGK